MERIFQRTEKLIGKANLQHLKNASVAVIGLGGVGSFAAEAICRSGVGKMLIVDSDRVEESNLNRQLPALISTIDQYKTDVVQERLLNINPELKIIKYTARVNAVNQAEILADHFDYVLDAIDSVTDKVELIRYCVERKLPIASSMGAANRLDPEKLKIDDIKNTSICPLAKRVRRDLRSYGIYEGIKTVYSVEQPVKVDYDENTRLGSIVFVTANAGLLLASIAIRDLLKVKPG